MHSCYLRTKNAMQTALVPGRRFNVRWSTDCFAGDAADAELRAGIARSGDRSAHVDAAAGILDHHRHETLAQRILRRVADTEIERQAGEINPREAALAQIAGEPGRGPAVILIERRV